MGEKAISTLLQGLGEIIVICLIDGRAFPKTFIKSCELVCIQSRIPPGSVGQLDLVSSGLFSDKVWNPASRIRKD